jgi:hypothetical protein
VQSRPTRGSGDARALCEARAAWNVAGRRRKRPPIGRRRSRGYCGNPRGLGLATATTSATFLPHLEQRIRVEGPVFVFPADRRYTDLRALDGDSKMKSALIGAALLAVTGVAFAASGYCPLCLMFWR